MSSVLIGETGSEISMPVLTSGFSVSSISESDLDTSGYVAQTPTMDHLQVLVGDQIYLAFSISDILKENSPKYDYVAILLREAGRTIGEYTDSSIRDTLWAGYGNSVGATVAGKLAFDDIVNLLQLEKEDKFYPDDNTPFLYISPEGEADLLKDSRWINSHRYAVGSVGNMGSDTAGEQDIYCDCRVRVTETMKAGYAMIVFKSPDDTDPYSIFAWKRPLTVKTERSEMYGRQAWYISERWGTKVMQPNSVGLISNC
ncbi:MAG: hypothetical protein ABSA11_09460 [Candidatus Bathyarchaeia archaeon]